MFIPKENIVSYNPTFEGRVVNSDVYYMEERMQFVNGLFENLADSDDTVYAGITLLSYPLQLVEDGFVYDETDCHQQKSSTILSHETPLGNGLVFLGTGLQDSGLDVESEVSTAELLYYFSKKEYREALKEDKMQLACATLAIFLDVDYQDYSSFNNYADMYTIKIDGEHYVALVTEGFIHFICFDTLNSLTSIMTKEDKEEVEEMIEEGDYVETEWYEDLYTENPKPKKLKITPFKTNPYDTWYNFMLYNFLENQSYSPDEDILEYQGGLPPIFKETYNKYIDHYGRDYAKAQI